MILNPLPPRKYTALERVQLLVQMIPLLAGMDHAKRLLLEMRVVHTALNKGNDSPEMARLLDDYQVPVAPVRAIPAFCL